MTDENAKRKPSSKSKLKTEKDQRGESESEVVEQAKELVEKGKAKSREFFDDVCDDLKAAKAVTARKSGSWLNAAAKAIGESARKVVEKTDKAAKEDRKAVEAAKKQRAQTEANLAATGSPTSSAKKTKRAKKKSAKKSGAKKAAAKKTGSKKTAAKKAGAKKSAQKRAAKKKSAAKKTTAKKAAAKKVAVENPATENPVTKKTTVSRKTMPSQETDEII